MLARTRKQKTAKQLERHFKGVANLYRIEIVKFIAENPGITLESIAENLDRNLKTKGEHTRRLVIAGLVNKEHEGRFVVHTLSPYGKVFYTFITTFSHS